jgi:hypothetical protein
MSPPIRPLTMAEYDTRAQRGQVGNGKAVAPPETQEKGDVMKLQFLGLRASHHSALGVGNKIPHPPGCFIGRKAQLIWTCCWAAGDHLAIVLLDVLGIWAHRHLQLVLAIFVHLILMVGIARLQRVFESLVHGWLQHPKQQ